MTEKIRALELVAALATTRPSPELEQFSKLLQELEEARTELKKIEPKYREAEERVRELYQKCFHERACAVPGVQVEI
jgi:flagellar biosynthesis chaperone FliJ